MVGPYFGRLASMPCARTSYGKWPEKRTEVFVKRHVFVAGLGKACAHAEQGLRAEGPTRWRRVWTSLSASLFGQLRELIGILCVNCEY